MQSSADIVVIGGGVIGTAITYYLSKKGLDVVLLDKQGLAAGTSSKCDGNVLVQDKMPGYDCGLARLSQSLFPEISEEIERDIEWTQKGSLLLIESEEELQVAKDFCRQMVEQDLPARILDKKHVHEDEPGLARDIIAGLEFDCDGSLNPMLLAYGLMEASQRNGARLKSRSEVQDIVLDAKGAVQAVKTAQGQINTPRVINAAGIWSPAIGEMVGLDIPVTPRQGQILVSERTGYVARRKVVEFGYLMAKFGSSGYERQVEPDMDKYGIALVFEPTRAGNFLLGSSRQFVGLDISCSRPVLRLIAKRAIRFFPVIKDISIIRSYAGLRPYVPDHMPIISDSEVPGFYVATGHEGDGIGLSLITGKLMSQMLCGETTEIDTSPLSLSRFKNNKFEH